MPTPRIHTPQPLTEGAELELEPAASAHLAKVLRLRAGADVTLFNGHGGEHSAQVVAVGRKCVRVRVIEHNPVERESALETHLGIGVSRGERMDWVVRKATELGVSHISPLFSARAGVTLQGKRAANRLDHWRQVAVSACEQCGRNRLPTIAPPQALPDWIGAVRAERKLVLHHRHSQGLDVSPGVASVALLIGPEGGLCDAEIDAALAGGFTALSLGPRVLRTETAPVAALALVQHTWGDMGEQG